MRRKRMISLAVIALVAGPAFADWTKISDSVDGSSYYDLSNAIRTNDIIRFKWLIDAASENETSKSALVTSEVNCAKNAIKHANVAEYTQHMAQGVVMKVSLMHNQWEPIIPDSGHSKLLQTFCSSVK